MAQQDTPAAGSDHPTTPPDTRALLAASHRPAALAPSRGALITEAIVAKAFAAWNDEFRATPDDFIAHHDLARMDTAEAAAKSAAYFMGLLREAGAA